jgi:uncharacterized membrane protein
MAAVDMFPPSHRDRCVTLEIRAKMVPGKGVHMKKLRIWASITLTLGILGLIALVLMFLALVDISHGEANVVGEWLIVRLGLLVIFFVIAATIICTGLIFKYFRDKDEREKRTTPD